MKSRYSHRPYHYQSNSGEHTGSSDDRRVSRGQWFFPAIDFTLMDLLQRLFTGLKRIFVAIKYQFYKNTSEINGVGGTSRSGKKWRIPWFKIGLIGIVVFLFTQKDIQFSINMRAPLNGEGAVDSPNDQDADRQPMNVAQAIPMKNAVGRKNRSQGNRLNGRSAGAFDGQFDDQEVAAYISRFRKVALMEMKKFGIPASIKMAWGIMESQAGRKPAQANDNNHFGPIMRGEPFSTAWENWRAHSLLLQQQYGGLLEGGLDHRQWIKMLNKAKIYNDSSFGQKLGQLIEKYDLHRLDQEAI